MSNHKRRIIAESTGTCKRIMTFLYSRLNSRYTELNYSLLASEINYTIGDLNLPKERLSEYSIQDELFFPNFLKGWEGCIEKIPLWAEYRLSNLPLWKSSDLSPVPV